MERYLELLACKPGQTRCAFTRCCGFLGPSPVKYEAAGPREENTTVAIRIDVAAGWLGRGSMLMLISEAGQKLVQPCTAQWLLHWVDCFDVRGLRATPEQRKLQWTMPCTTLSWWIAARSRSVEQTRKKDVKTCDQGTQMENSMCWTLTRFPAVSSVAQVKAMDNRWPFSRAMSPFRHSSSLLRSGRCRSRHSPPGLDHGCRRSDTARRTLSDQFRVTSHGTV